MDQLPVGGGASWTSGPISAAAQLTRLGAPDQPVVASMGGGTSGGREARQVTWGRGTGYKYEPAACSLDDGRRRALRVFFSRLLRRQRLLHEWVESSSVLFPVLRCWVVRLWLEPASASFFWSLFGPQFPLDELASFL